MTNPYTLDPTTNGYREANLEEILRDALALIDIRVLDHLIVAGSDIISLAERGVL
jgi:DNA repair protein RadC